MGRVGLMEKVEKMKTRPQNYPLFRINLKGKNCTSIKRTLGY